MNSWPAAKGVNPRVYEAFRITPALRSLHAEVVGNVGDVLWIIMATIGIVLLVACANVATLLLVRAEGRQQELAVRASLGAGRGRIVRGLLLESLLLALVSGVLGVALAYGGLRVLVAMGPANLPRLDDISLDVRGLAFALVISCASGCCSGCCRRSGTAGHASGTRCGAADARRRAAASGTVPARAGGDAGGARAGAARQLGADDPDVAGLAQRRARLHRAGVDPDGADLRPGGARAEPERVARLQNDIVDRVVGATRRHVRWLLQRHAHGRPRHAVGRHPPEGAPPLGLRTAADACLQAVSPGFFTATGTRLHRRAATTNGPTCTAGASSSSCPRASPVSCGARRRWPSASACRPPCPARRGTR